jgi:hypothetical protein
MHSTQLLQLCYRTRRVRLTYITMEKVSIQLELTAIAPTAACPLYGVPSAPIHCRYRRYPTDPSWGMRVVRLHLMVRKFICRYRNCARRIFTERLPELVAPYAAPAGASGPHTPHPRAAGRQDRRVGVAAGPSLWHDPGRSHDARLKLVKSQGYGTGRLCSSPPARPAGRLRKKRMPLINRENWRTTP